MPRDDLFGGDFDEKPKAAVKDGRLFGEDFASDTIPDKAARTPGLVSGVARSVAEGVPIIGGVANRANAFTNATLAPFVERFLTPGPDDISRGGESFWERYQKSLEIQNQMTKNFEEERPFTAAGANLAGGVGAMLPLAATQAGARGLGLVGSLAERTLLGGASGAAINAADAGVRGGDVQQAGMIGGGLGAAFPIAGRTVGAGVDYLMGAPRDAVTQGLLRTADRLGIPISPPQASDSPFVRKLSQMAGQVPGGGGGAHEAVQDAAISRAISRTFGENAEDLTWPVMARAKKRIGGMFDRAEKRGEAQLDSALGTDLRSILSGASIPAIGTEGEKRVAGMVNEILKRSNNGVWDGETFHNMMKKGAPLYRMSRDPDPNIKQIGVELRNALQDSFERNSPAGVAELYRNARHQYFNMKTVEPVVKQRADGHVSPAGFARRVANTVDNFAYGNGGDLGDIARVSQRFLRQPKDSGTPIGMQALQLMGQVAPGVGAGLGIGGGAYASGQDPLTSIGMGLAGIGGTAASARAINTFLNNPNVLEQMISRGNLVTPYARPGQ